MSSDATRWAWLQSGIKSTSKLVLLSLADRAGETHECYPSIGRLCQDTCLDRKTVIGSLRALCDCGLISDTGKKVGRTGQIIVYQLIGVDSRNQDDEFEEVNSTKTGTVPKPEQFRFSDETVPFFPDNSPVFPTKESQKRDTEPNIEPNIEPKKESKNINNRKSESRADFENAFSIYPKRKGDNPKEKAFKAWSARLKEGFTANEMVSGVHRYFAYCQAEGNIGTQYIKQAATFFGPDKAFLESWEVIQTSPSSSTPYKNSAFGKQPTTRPIYTYPGGDADAIDSTAIEVFDAQARL